MFSRLLESFLKVQNVEISKKALLRKHLLEDDIVKVKETVNEIGDKDETYKILCEFHTECDVKGVVLHKEPLEFIIDYVVKYRLDYAAKNPSKIDTSDTENSASSKENTTNEREELLKELLIKYQGDLNPIEEITILKTVAKIMKPLILDKSALRLKWKEIHFVICIFVATKVDKTHLPYWLLDNYYQLMVTEASIKTILWLLLSRLEGNVQEDEVWNELNEMYNISNMYYLVLKMFWHFKNFFDHGSSYEYYTTNKEELCLQTIGECLSQLSKLKYTDFEDSSYITQKMNLFSTILVQERHKLSHSHQISNVKVNTDKLGLFILELIQIVRSKIEERLLNEFQAIVEQSVDNLLKRVNQIAFTSYSWINYVNLNSLEKIYEILYELEFNETNSNAICDIGNKLMNVLSLPKCENVTLINFINNLKRRSEILKDEMDKQEIMEQLKQISLQPFVNIKTLLDLFLSLIPDSQNKRHLQNWNDNLNSDYIMKEPKNADDETFIQNILIQIEKNIEHDVDKRGFAEKISMLMRERCDFYEGKIFGNSNPKRRNNQIQSIVTNKYKNLADFEIAEQFLKQIKWKNARSVVDKMREKTTIHISGQDTVFKEMSVLDSFELAKKFGAELSFDFNFLDFECPIPVGRNMRNYLAHGDICVEVMCSDRELVVEKHYSYLGIFKSQHQNLGFSRPDDFKLVRENFEKQMGWAREAWKALNWNNDTTVLLKSDPMAFRVRDPAGLTIVHYSLRDINKNNEFLNFLIRKLKQKHSIWDRLFQNMFNNYVTSNIRDLSKKEVKPFWEVDNQILDYDSISFYVNDLCKEDMGTVLAQILCFNCPDLDIFKTVFSIIEPKFPWDEWLEDEIKKEYDSYCGLLQIAVAKNQLEIVKFLLERDHFKKLINSTYKGYTALEYAIMSGNVEMASILIDNGANVNHNSSRFTANLSYGIYVFQGDGLPISVALANGDPEMLSLLKSKGMRLDNQFLFDVQRKIKMNINPEMWNVIYNSFCKTKEDFEMLLHIACINGKYEIVKAIIEDGLLNWGSVKETILMSCYNMKSPEILKYLLDKKAVLKLEHLKHICLFGSLETVEFLIRSNYLKELSVNDLIGRNKEIVGSLLDAKFQIDWKAVDFLPLSFIMERNPPQDFITKRITFFLMHSSSEMKSKFIKYLNERDIKIPLFVVEYAATELQWDKCKWLQECNFDEKPEDLNGLLKTAVKYDHYLLARIALNRGASISISIDKKSLLDFYIEKNEGKVSEMMKLLSEFKCPSRFGIDFNNFTLQDQLLFGHLTKNMNIIKRAGNGGDRDFKYSNFRDGTLLHILYHYGISLTKREGGENSVKNIDNCTAFDLLVLNNPLRPLPLHFSRISPFQRLIAGVLRSNFEVMKDALENGADVNSVLDHFNLYTPLHVAVRENLINVVEFLLENGSNPNQMYSYQQLPVETSILSYDNYSMVELLLRHMTTLTSDDFDYLQKLAKKHGRMKVLKVLIRSCSHNLKTRLDFEKALKRGLNINSVSNEYFETYLHIASFYCDFDLVEFFLENGADPLVRNCFEELPIDLAVFKDDSSIVELFLRHNLQSYNLNYLLKLAFEYNSPKTAKFLLENKAEPNDDLLKFPCQMPNNGGLELAKIYFMFDERCKEYTYYFGEAVTNCNYVLAKSIITRVYQRSNVYLNDIKDLEVILKNGGNLNLGPDLDFTMHSFIPYLHYATFCCSSDVLQLLLKNGANPLIRDCFNRNPMEYAIRLDDIEKVNLLFEGIPYELRERDSDGHLFFDEVKSYNLTDLLMLATECNSLKSIKFLIRNGSAKIGKDPKIIDDMLKIACGLELNKGLEIVKYIKETNIKALDLNDLVNVSKETNNYEIVNLLTLNQTTRPDNTLRFMPIDITVLPKYLEKIKK